MMRKLTIAFLLIFCIQTVLQGAEDKKGADYFAMTVWPAVPERVVPAFSWQTDQGLIVEQKGTFFLLKDGKAWEKLAVDGAKALVPGASFAVNGVLYVVQPGGIASLSYEPGMIRQKDTAFKLPADLTVEDLVIVGSDCYAIGSDNQGENVFALNGKPLKAWSDQRFSKLAVAYRQFVIYVLARDSQGKTLSVHEYNTLNGKWTDLGSTDQDIPLDAAFACGDAHILTLGKNRQTISAFYVIQKEWVEFSGMELPAGEFSLATTSKGFTVITAEDTAMAEAVMGKTNYGWIDHLVVIAFFVIMLVVGKVISNREKSGNDFFRGGQRLPWWAVGLSMFATGASAISLMAMPAQAYMQDWLYFFGGVVQMMLLPVVFLWVVPIARRLRMATAYEYLENRYHPSVRYLGSTVFVCMQMLGRMASIMLLPSIALSAISGMPMELSIILMGIITTIYCTMGGLEAVIWTDVIQSVVMILAMILCVVWVFASMDQSAADAWQLVSDNNKLNMLCLDWDTTRYMTIIAVFSTVVTSVGSLSDQNFIQRVQATKDEKATRKAVATQLCVAVPLNACLFGLGTCLFVFYHFNAADVSPAMKADGIFPLFAAQQLPHGLAGLVVAALMAATMSTLSSAINSVSNVGVDDFVRKIRGTLTDRERLLWGKGLTLFLGLLGTVLALVLAKSNLSSIWDLFLYITGLFSAPLIGIYTLGIFTKRANVYSAWGGLLGAITLTVLCKNVFEWHASFYLPLGVLSCVVIGYLISLVTPRHHQNLKGLTIYSLPEAIDGATAVLAEDVKD